ncbi:MAG: DUF3772 domain-containing protein [Rhodobacteraceae bacterium]|nr:DUF3772 domain-containing protein [Paracoccaceae bacterium]
MRAVLACLLALLIALAAPVVSGPALAQETAADAAIDYEAWERDAQRAEEVLERDLASNDALERLRTDIADWRGRFLAAQSANQSRIETLRGQISALGPPPEEGATEAQEIANRRAELNDQLARLQAPGIAAVEAHSRADGIIREIDATIRSRQASEKLQLYPSPLAPTTWPEGFSLLTRGIETIWGEIGAAWGNPVRRADLRDNLPVILLYLVVAVAFLVRGPAVFRMLARRLQGRGSDQARRLAAFALSLGQVVLPVGGMFLFVQAIEATGMTGPLVGALIAALPAAAFAVFAARWLSGHLFGQPGGGGGLLSEAETGQGRFLVNMLGLLVAGEVLRLAFIGEFRPSPSEAALSVWGAPVVAVASLLLYRIGVMLRRLSVATDEGETAFRDRITRLMGSATLVVAALGLILPAVGYVPAANAIVWPMILSLGLVGVLILVQQLVEDAYAVLTGAHEAAKDQLIPVLIGFALFLVAIPVFALIWGARVADLSEIWTRAREGVQFGETRISPEVFLTFAIVFAIGYTATRLVQGALRSSILPKTRMDKGGQNAISSGVGYLGIFLSALIAVSTAGIDLSSLAIVAGALSVGIGFGLQNIVSNFVSGIILLIERPVSEGDWIEVGGQMGIVKSISVRSTRIETFDRTDVIVPNADLVSGPVTNWTRSNLNGRLVLNIGVAYGTDTRKVDTILREIAEAHPLVVINPPPSVTFEGFGADSLDFTIRAVLRDVNFILSVRNDINHEIARRFTEEGIEIPFAQRDIHLRNPEALRAVFAPAATATGDAADPPRARLATDTTAPPARPDEDDL